MLEAKPKRRKLKHEENTNCADKIFTLPVDIDAQKLALCT